MSDTRLVPMTREGRDWLERFADNTPSEELSELARSMVVAWDEAARPDTTADTK